MKNTVSVPRQEKRRFWEKHILRWPSSGLSQAGYCQEHGLRLKSFGYWKRKIMASKASPSLVEVPPAVSAQLFPLSKPIRLQIGHKYRIEIERGFDAETLSLLLGVLER